MQVRLLKHMHIFLKHRAIRTKGTTWIDIFIVVRR